jgi:hypothetical protein
MPALSPHRYTVAVYGYIKALLKRYKALLRRRLRSSWRMSHSSMRYMRYMRFMVYGSTLSAAAIVAPVSLYTGKKIGQFPYKNRK